MNINIRIFWQSLTTNVVINDTVNNSFYWSPSFSGLHRHSSPILTSRKREAGSIRRFPLTFICLIYWVRTWMYPAIKVYGANMGPVWARQDPGGPHVGPVNFAIWVAVERVMREPQLAFREVVNSLILCPWWQIYCMLCIRKKYGGCASATGKFITQDMTPQKRWYRVTWLYCSFVTSIRTCSYWVTYEEQR